MGETVAASFSPDARVAAAIGHERVAVVETLTGRVVRSRVVGCLPLSSAFAENGRIVLVSCGDGSIRRFDATSLQMRGRINPGPHTPIKLVAHDDELYVADVGSAVSMVRAGRVTELTRPGCGEGARGLTVNPAGTVLVVVGDGAGKFGCTFVGLRQPGRAWSIMGDLLPRRPAQQARGAAISPDGRVVAVGYADGAVAMFTLPNETPGWMWTGVAGSIRGLAFTRDGRHVIVATREGVVARLPACLSCFDTKGLAGLALRRVSAARSMGLTGR